RKGENVQFVRYESFVVDPAATLARCVAHLGLEPFDFDPDHVESRGGDTDEVWRGKFPHDGTGPIKVSGSSWEDTLDPELAALIAGVFPFFMSTFSYGG
ncbi:MAG TPA: hypothetical protein VMZ50_10370, partial [Phycisphaerae bacterium]|nr:hypothetical protein [Phycisphaerae bacterium]